MEYLMNEYPYAGSYLDRHGKRRWRFRRNHKTISLPHSPGHPVFEAAYAAALSGKPIEKAKVQRLPTAAVPCSLRAAWRTLTTETVGWKNLDPGTRQSQTAIAERFLNEPIVEGEPLTYGDVAIADLKRKHINAILARRAATPHAAAHLLRLIRKLTGVALDQEWIEIDPTYRIKFRPPYKGWKAWPAEVRAAYEKRWPIGTTPRLVYALALCLGHRRADVAAIRWSDIENVGANVVQSKTAKALWIPMLPELKKVLEGAERKGETIAVTQYGRAFSPTALGMRMQDWTKAAGIPPGYTLHGLRKTLGKMLAESGATTRQIMAILGHDDIAHAELYTREAEQRLLATDGMDKLTTPNL
jgi:integrase